MISIKNTVKAGDLVISLAGRDKGNIFLVVNVEQDYAFLVDGKIRKVQNLKKKKIKHIKSVFVANLNDFAIKIQRGELVGNKRINRLIKAQTQKIQED